MSGAPAAVDVLESVRDAPTGQAPQSFERERRTRTVAAKPFAPHVVAGFDADAGMKVPTVALDCEGAPVGVLLARAMPIVLLAVPWS